MGAVMTQIPISWLDSNIFVRVPVDGEYGGEHSEPVLIRNVRFRSEYMMRFGGIKLMDGSAGLIYIDAVNSNGAFEVPVDSIVQLDSVGAPEMTVVKSVPYKGFFGVIHHWEIEVR